MALTVADCFDSDSATSCMWPRSTLASYSSCFSQFRLLPFSFPVLSEASLFLFQSFLVGVVAKQTKRQNQQIE